MFLLTFTSLYFTGTLFSNFDFKSQGRGFKVMTKYYYSDGVIGNILPFLTSFIGLILVQGTLEFTGRPYRP